MHTGSDTTIQQRCQTEIGQHCKACQCACTERGGELASPGCLVVWALILAAVNIVRLSPLRSQLGTLPSSWVNIRPSRASCFSRASTSNLPPNSIAGYSPPSSILTITSCSVGMSITVSARHQHIIRSQPDLLINRSSKGRKQVR